MAAVVRLQTLRGLRKLVPVVTARQNQTLRTISSTPNKNGTSSPSTCDETNNEKNWVSYGFDFKDKEEDRNVTKSTLFITITVCLVFGGFVIAYLPDPQLRDWSQREAYLELRRREELGLPLIDPNLVDPSKVILPSEEELADTEIII